MAKILVVDCGAITVVDQAMSGVYGVPSEASDGHSGHAKRVTMLLVKKGRSSRRHCLKVVKEKWQAASGLKTPDRKTCFSMLEKYMSFEFREELLQERVPKTLEWVVHAHMGVRSRGFSFLL